MKYRKALFASIWIIAIAIILWISGIIIAEMGITYHAGGWFDSGWYELTSLYWLGVGMVCSAMIALILGVFGIITTFIREYLDRKKGEQK